MPFEYYLYYFYYTYLGFPFVIRVAVTFITVFLPLFIVIMFILLRIRRNFYLKKRLQRKFYSKYLETIRNLLISKEVQSYETISHLLDCNVKKLTKKEKRVLTNNILNIHGKEEFINDSNYKKVIDYFGLREFWEKRLTYGSLASRQRALRKLDDFDIEIPGSIITSLTYNRNQYLRKRARSSYMYFSKNNPYKFLDEDFDKTFNNWDKIEIHRTLSRRLHEGLPLLTQWIKNSTHSEYRCFLVDELRYFQQKESCPFLLEMVDTEDMELRKHCIEALGELKYQKAEEKLIRDYPLQPLPVQQATIKAVKNLSTGKALSFLEDAYNSVHDRDSERIILDAIYGYGDSGRQLFNSMKADSGGFSKLVFEHVSNPLIKFN